MKRIKPLIAVLFGSLDFDDFMPNIPGILFGFTVWQKFGQSVK